jgi:hypothetical protein
MEDFLSIKGDFQTSLIPELLYSIYKSKETGILKCSFLNVEKCIYLHEGQLVYASSNDPDDRLGESLLKYGDITINHYFEASKLISSNKKLGAILCEMNAITPEHLIEGIKRQILDITYSIFQWKYGEWEFVMTEFEEDKIILFNIPMEAFIFEGIKKINYFSKIINGLSSLLNMPVKTQDCEKALMNISLDTEENHVLNLCNGSYDIQTICNLSYLSNLETCKLLWALKAIGAISLISKSSELKESKEEVKAEYELLDIVESYNEIFSFLYNYLSQRIHESVNSIMDKAIQQINDLYNNRLAGLDLNYGRLDFDSILHNFADLSANDRKTLLISILEELIYSVIMQSKNVLSSNEHKAMLNEVSKIRK